MECQKDGIKSPYIGESHRSFYDRAREHHTALRNKNKTYAVVKHWLECHPESKTPPEYSYHLLGKHRSAVERQIKEGLAIKKESREAYNLLNGKGEWGLNVVPRLQSEKDRLGVIPENPDSNSVSTGKRSAEIREDELHANTTDTCTISNISALGPNAELAFSGQFRQHKRAKRQH